MTRHIHADHIIAAANDTSTEWQRMSDINKDWANVGKSGSFTFFPDSEYRQRPAPHPHQAMIDQAKADPSIQWQVEIHALGWMPKTASAFIAEFKYRQKPAEPKMVDMWQFAQQSRDGSWWASGDFYQTIEDAHDDSPENVFCRIEGSKITVPEVSQ
jgi:hypothetical protein